MTGVLEVADRGAALVQIERAGLFPVAIEAPQGSAAPAAEKSVGSRDFTELLPPSVRQYLKRKHKPGLQEMARYTQQLANLLKSGMPLTTALHSMTHLETKGISSDVSKQLKQDVMEGKGLSEAMSRQPLIFSELYINMVKAGEQSGSLVDVLRRMAAHFERFAEVQSKFKSALIYPTFVLCVGTGIGIFFMTYMLPKFMSIFTSFSVPLPLATRILIGISNTIRDWWWAILAVIATLAFVANRFVSSEDGRNKLDQWKMNMPIIGKVVKLNLFGQFARTLATLLQNGVPVLTSLEITEQIIPNKIIREAIRKARQDVTDGKTLAQPLARSKLFPQLMVDMIRIGEETGDVPGALANVADTYETELTTALRVMTNMIEPLIICVMAVFVGFLLVSVLSAMFSITSSISAG